MPIHFIQRVNPSDIQKAAKKSQQRHVKESKFNFTEALKTQFGAKSIQQQATEMASTPTLTPLRPEIIELGKKYEGVEQPNTPPKGFTAESFPDENAYKGPVTGNPYPREEAEVQKRRRDFKISAPFFILILITQSKLKLVFCHVCAVQI